MPINIQTQKIKYKDGDEYVSIDALTDESTAERIALIEAKGTEQITAVQNTGTQQVNAVQAKGTEVLNSIPSDYSDLVDEVSDVKGALSNNQGILIPSQTLVDRIQNISGYFDAIYKQGCYIAVGSYSVGDTVSLTETDTENRCYTIFPCSANDVICVTAHSGSLYRSYAFLDADNKLLVMDTGSATRDHYNVTAPANTAKCICSANSQYDYSCTIGASWKDGVNSDIANIKNTQEAFNDKFSEVIPFTTGGYINVNVEIGEVVNITVTTSSNRAYAVADCYDEDIFSVTGQGATNFRLYAFVDKDNKLLYKDDLNSSRTDYVIIAPTGARKVIFGTEKNVPYGAKLLYQSLEGLKFNKPEVMGKIATVMEYNRNAKYLNIAFMTDSHSNAYNADEAINLMQKIAEANFCDINVHGGDLYTCYDTDDFETSVQSMLEQINRYKPCNFLYVKGNHDDFHAPFGSDENMTKFQYYMMFNNANRNRIVVDVNDPYGNYYYIDFDEEDIRVIILNSFYAFGNSGTINFGTAQINWLTNVALNTTKKCVVFSHWYQTGCEIETPLANATNLICLIYGHTHQDGSSTSDGFTAINVTRAYSTSDNGAVSIFTFDTTNDKIYETRFGRGTDREFSY